MAVGDDRRIKLGAIPELFFVGRPLIRKVSPASCRPLCIAPMFEKVGIGVKTTPKMP